MILVAGGTGNLGSQVVRLLVARGLDVRILTRDPARARHLAGSHVEIVVGDIREEEAVKRAVAGVTTVVSAVQGFGGVDPQGPLAVDEQGNLKLIAAARSAAVDHFVLVSIAQAARDHPIKHFRTKYVAERALIASGLGWTIIRPTAYMETFIGFLVRPYLATGTAQMVGRGDNPINFVSSRDVARFVDLAVVDPSRRAAMIEVPGPDNLSLKDLIRVADGVTGRSGRVRHAPVALMRLVSAALRPFRPTIAAQIASAVVLATRDMRFDPAERRRAYPTIPLTTLEQVMRDELATS